MNEVRCQISVSLDGFVAGPNQSHDNPIGEGVMRLHEWAFRTLSWRAQQGLDGGEHNADAAALPRPRIRTRSPPPRAAIDERRYDVHIRRRWDPVGARAGPHGGRREARRDRRRHSRAHGCHGTERHLERVTGHAGARGSTMDVAQPDHSLAATLERDGPVSRAVTPTEDVQAARAAYAAGADVRAA